jgi:hypothetical protein
MEGIWAGSGSRTPHTPYQERSRLSSYDAWRGGTRMKDKKVVHMIEFNIL